jgi:hypothetical protein
MTESQAIEHRHTIRLARWSAALGTLGLITAAFGVGVLLALVAIGCALVALNQLATLRAHDARGVALLGLVAGVMALLVFPLLAATAVPRFIAARQKAMHERCHRNLIALNASASRNAAEVRCPTGGRYRTNVPNDTIRCSIPLHNERPGSPAPPPRLRFSFKEVSCGNPHAGGSCRTG